MALCTEFGLSDLKVLTLNPKPYTVIVFQDLGFLRGVLGALKVKRRGVVG